MPATRPSTRVQRRAQPAAPRRTTSRRRTAVTSATIQRHETREVGPEPEASSSVATTATAPETTSPATTVPDETVQRIVSAVSQAVLASLNGGGIADLSPPSSAVETRELPIVASGITSSAEATMQGPVASALTHLSGETNFIQVTPSPDPGLPKFNSINVPIDANVSTKIKAKIWAHEFIDFNVLLSSGAGDTRYQLSVSSQNGSALPALSLEPSQKPKAIANIGTWTSAFQIFVGVYTVKYPMEAPALMKYSEVVRDLALRGADWRFYDTQFRLLRQANPTEFPWGSTHWELWIRAQNFNNARFSKPQPTLRNSSSSSAAGPFVPKGFCRKFHRGDHCAGCNYKHACYKCGVVHPALRCNFRSSQHNSSSAPTSAKSRPSNTSSN